MAKCETKVTKGKLLITRGKEYTVKDAWDEDIKAIAVMVKGDRILFVDSDEFNSDNEGQDGAFWVDRQDVKVACDKCGK